MCTSLLSILLLAAIGAELIGPHSGLQVDKQKVGKVTDSVDAPTMEFVQYLKTHTLPLAVYMPLDELPMSTVLFF